MAQPLDDPLGSRRDLRAARPVHEGRRDDRARAGDEEGEPEGHRLGDPHDPVPAQPRRPQPPGPPPPRAGAREADPPGAAQPFSSIRISRKGTLERFTAVSRAPGGTKKTLPARPGRWSVRPSSKSASIDSPATSTAGRAACARGSPTPRPARAPCARRAHARSRTPDGSRRCPEPGRPSSAPSRARITREATQRRSAESARR